VGVVYYLVSLEKKLAFDLGKSGGHFFGNLDLLGAGAPKTVEECVEKFRAGWLNFRELTANEYEARAAEARTQPRPWFKPNDWVFAPEFERYIKLRDDYRQERTLEEAVAEHRESVEYTRRWAERVWAFVEDPRVAGGDWTKLEVINDCGDLPWWDEEGWVLLGSRYLADEVPHSL